MTSQKPTVTLLRQALLLILVVSVVGTGIELLLLKHTDGWWQLVPLLLAGATLAVVAWYGVTGSAGSLRALQGVMLLCLASGVIGFVQHFSGNVGFARDSNPSLSGMELYKEALMGSTPTLAPGTMIQVALLGLAFAFRHPGLRGAASSGERGDDNPSSGTLP